MLFSKSSEVNRIVIISVFISFLYISGGLMLFFKKNKTKIQELVSFLCVFIGATFVYRSIWAYLKEALEALNFDNHVQIISYLFLVVGSFSFPMILLLILKEVEEKEIKINNKTLKLLNRNKTKFFSIIAHDLKGPLGTYNQMIEMLIDRHKEMPSDKMEEFLKKLQNSSKQTFNLLENLLQWSRSESGTIKIKPKQLKLNEIINSVQLLMKHSVEIKNLNVSVKIGEDETVYCDHNMIMTVFRNLISNAIKFTPNNGQITITSKNIKENNIEICIEDTGVGIASKNLKAIFDIDTETSTKGTNNESGTGLGLKLAKEFLEKNNGSIKIESTETTGTKVFIQLPKHKL
ncbi:HAMP domain-containing sensor histidine kinase [Lutibacter sp.]|uniref:sensor histidine kinase n=1 Tax=Lutibacter sp. TaxID=1925666 RepID=UPI001A26C7AA|nr:HAMP domain-containing sensor histidine kinase [Lutibacter sp.]MBI9041494.1 HAMP domain-containing histidine kinase [Lutibacter sp.]